ncbi:hypothetical protein [Rhodobacter sp. NTK016B]|uniref:hypothetical protein n=1 Tax=Rhodobacter sp. NTK016B TaxID=2759676 RepID=UPI00257091BC|nr:hypothetical protein [Rhodobacter sp. NTK016B]
MSGSEPDQSPRPETPPESQADGGNGASQPNANSGDTAPKARHTPPAFVAPPHAADDGASDPATTNAPAAKPARMAGEGLAFGLSLVWLGMMVAALVVLDRQGMSISDTLGLVVIALAVFLPVALIWVAVLVLKAARGMRDDAARLQSTVEGMRRAWIREQQAAGLALKPSVEEKLDEIAAAQRAAEDRMAMFSTRRHMPFTVSPNAKPETADDAQPALALDNPEPAPEPVRPADFIRALNFPETEHDEEGFAALRRAMEDHGTALLIHAAQSVLTVLAQEGIYMDDLRPDRARPEIWRAFALGARGPEVAALGGIRDRSSLALTYARMRSDPGFREAAHHFLRTFDRRFVVFEAAASDGEIAQFAETRSARAFMLLGRVTGIFG